MSAQTPIRGTMTRKTPSKPPIEGTWLGPGPDPLVATEREAATVAHPQRAHESSNFRRSQTSARALSGCAGEEAKTEDLELQGVRSQPPRQIDGTDAPKPGNWGGFVLERRIGEGAFAEVFLAYDPKLDTRFALKLLKPHLIAEYGARFIGEARRLRQVQHPNIVTIHGVDEHDGRPGLWMDYLQGPNLEQRLAQGALGCWEAAAIGMELCRALAAIHAAGLVHGDVKPANVMRVAGGGRHILTDFGAAGIASPTTLLQSCLCGTPLNMAPEVLLHRTRNSPASDIYSLGVLLYRLVSGQYPVDAVSCEELAAKHARGDTVPLVDRCPDLPLEFLHIVNNALAFRAVDRYASVGHLEGALSSWFSHHESQKRSRRVDRIVAWVVRRRRAMVFAAVTALVLGGAFLFWKVPLRAHAVLVRLNDAHDEIVAPETVLHPGDRLWLACRSSHESYVYVFNEATREHGQVNILFPLEEQGLRNPLSAGKEHILPHPEWVMKLDETGGTERILIVVSKHPVANLATWSSPASLRGIHPEPITSDTSTFPSQLDRMVGELGAPSWSLWWHVFELESESP